MLFGDAISAYLKWPETWQMFMASAALTSMLSWVVLGAMVRIINRWNPPKGE